MTWTSPPWLARSPDHQPLRWWCLHPVWAAFRHDLAAEVSRRPCMRDTSRSDPVDEWMSPGIDSTDTYLTSHRSWPVSMSLSRSGAPVGRCSRIPKTRFQSVDNWSTKRRWPVSGLVVWGRWSAYWTATCYRRRCDNLADVNPARRGRYRWISSPVRSADRRSGGPFAVRELANCDRRKFRFGQHS